MELRIPNIGVNDSEALLVAWLVPEGSLVRRGQAVAALETSKANIEVEAEDEGYIFFAARHDGYYAINSVIGHLMTEPERPTVEPVIKKVTQDSSNVLLTKKAEKLVKEKGIDITSLPSGILLSATDVIKILNEAESGPKILTPPSGRIPVAIYGTGTGGEICYEVLDLLRIYQVDCFLDDTPGRDQERFLGKPIHSGKQLGHLPSMGVTHCASLIADRTFRASWLDICEKSGVIPLTIIHPHAWVSPSARLGRGCFIKAGAVIETGCVIGDGTLIDNGVILPHHVQIGRCVHLAPGTRMGGQVSVGDRTLLGVGASVVSRIAIGRDVVVLPGTVVDQPIENGIIIGGNPSKIMGKNKRA